MSKLDHFTSEFWQSWTPVSTETHEWLKANEDEMPNHGSNRKWFVPGIAQLDRMHLALDALNEEKARYSPEWFAVVSEGPLEEIRRLEEIVADREWPLLCLTVYTEDRREPNGVNISVSYKTEPNGWFNDCNLPKTLIPTLIEMLQNIEEDK